MLALLGGLALPPGALAQESAANVPPDAGLSELPGIEAEREILFRRMMAEPANLELAFRYAALSSRAGDLEGAIATLERMLIFAPGLPRLQFELGVLYFRLGAYTQAAVYFEGALAAHDAPPDVISAIGPYLASIDEHTEVDTFRGAVVFGTRYQTNANAAPEVRTFSFNDFDFPLVEAPDVNGFVAGSFHFSHDLASQGDRIEAHIRTYGALYAERDELNTGLAELTIGPSFNLQRFHIDDARLGVYAILGGVLLGGDPYFLSGGVGARLDKGLGQHSWLRTRFEYRREDFRDTDDRPTASDRTGQRYRASATLEHRLTQRLTVFATLDGERRETRRDYLSHWEAGVSIGGTVFFESPIASQDELWSATLSGGYISRTFDEPDFVIDFDDVQEDDEFFVQGSLSIPLRDEWSVQAVGGYRNVSSNYDIRNYDNFSASIGLMKIF